MGKKVRIRYWEQQSFDTGRWNVTEPMSRKHAKELLRTHIFERGEIVSVNVPQEG